MLNYCTRVLTATRHGAMIEYPAQAATPPTYELAEGVIEQPEKIDVTVADKMTKTQNLAIVLFDILQLLLHYNPALICEFRIASTRF